MKDNLDTRVIIFLSPQPLIIMQDRMEDVEEVPEGQLAFIAWRTRGELTVARIGRSG